MANELEAQRNQANQAMRYIAKRLERDGLRYETKGQSTKDLTLQLDATKRLISSLEEDLDEAPDPHVWIDGSSVSVVAVLTQAFRYRNDVLQEISRRTGDDQMLLIKDAVSEKVADPIVRQELSDLVAEIQKQRDELDTKIKAEETAEARELQKIELMERRWKVRRTMLDREPAAVLVGTVLLGVIGLALIIAMFTHTAVPEILSSAFLLILGFFFGQTAGRGKESSDNG